MKLFRLEKNNEAFEGDCEALECRILLRSANFGKILSDKVSECPRIGRWAGRLAEKFEYVKKYTMQVTIKILQNI